MSAENHERELTAEDLFAEQRESYEWERSVFGESKVTRYRYPTVEGMATRGIVGKEAGALCLPADIESIAQGRPLEVADFSAGDLFDYLYYTRETQAERVRLENQLIRAVERTFKGLEIWAYTDDSKSTALKRGSACAFFPQPMDLEQSTDTPSFHVRVVLSPMLLSRNGQFAERNEQVFREREPEQYEARFRRPLAAFLERSKVTLSRVPRERWEDFVERRVRDKESRGAEWSTLVERERYLEEAGLYPPPGLTRRTSIVAGIAGAADVLRELVARRVEERKLASAELPDEDLAQDKRHEEEQERGLTL